MRLLPCDGFQAKASEFRAPWMIFWVGFGLRVLVILIGHTYKVRVPMDHFGFGWEMGPDCALAGCWGRAMPILSTGFPGRRRGRHRCIRC